VNAKVEIFGKPRVLPGAPTILPENRHELWHLDDRGDWEVAYFDLPVGPNMGNHMVKAAKTTWSKWVDMQARSERGSKVPTTEPRIVGPYVIPQVEDLDYRRYMMIARWKQTKPILADLDTASQIAEAEVPSGFTGLFIESMRRLTERPWNEVVQAAGRNAALAVQAQEEQALFREIERLRRHNPNANA
jgi:hypothetical protein